jgi:F-type H+-transporting ATPase subunit b
MEALGLDIKLLLAQVVNFLLLWFILSKFLYKPILKMLDERKKKIKDGLDNAVKIEQKLAGIEQKEKEILKSATVKAQKEEAELIALAKTQSVQIIETAKQSASRESQQALERIRAEELAVYERIKGKIITQISNEVVAKLSTASDKSKFPMLSKILGK